MPEQSMTNAGTANSNSSESEHLSTTNINYVPEVNELLQYQPKASKASKASKALKGYAYPDTENRQGIT